MTYNKFFHNNTLGEKNSFNNSLSSYPYKFYDDESSIRTNEIIPPLNQNYNNDFIPSNFTYNADNLFASSNEVLEEDEERADSLRKKIKRRVLEYSMKFINKNITNKKYRIEKIERKQVNNVKVDFEQNFMYRTLGDIFSAKVSSKLTSIIDPENYNKIRIQKLRSSDEKLRNIFDITFIVCLKHFFGLDIKEELIGMKTSEEISYKTEKEKKDLINYAKVYEVKVLQSKPRNRHKNII
jgi:hypothetical protein